MQIQHKVPLSSHTTIKLGGVATEYISCTSDQDIVDALSYAKEHNLSVHVLGGGSNTVFSDTGFNGLVIHIHTRGITSDGPLATAAAGEVWDTVVQFAIEHSLAGIECLSGIPGSVGGTPFQNVGAYGQEVAETIEYVDVIDRETGEKKRFLNSECAFAYRTSRFKTTDRDRYIITSVTFRLLPNGAASARYPELIAALDGQDVTLLSVRNAVLTLRKKKSMVIDPSDPNCVSCGSFFTNPIVSRLLANAIPQEQGTILPQYPAGNMEDGTPLVKLSAAWLVEHAGFPKGTRRGSVGTSSNHSLALVNMGGTSQELMAFAHEIQDTVQAKFGIRLEMEPIVV
jgi:UDP-N-acetylmuramate dehydrogenase